MRPESQEREKREGTHLALQMGRGVRGRLRGAAIYSWQNQKPSAPELSPAAKQALWDAAVAVLERNSSFFDQGFTNDGEVSESDEEVVA
jgi:hypothetical protein